MQELFQQDPERLVAFAAVVLGICIVALPVALFAMSRSWAQSQPENASSVLTGAVILSVLSILTAAAILLAAIGWLPSPTEW